MRGLGAVFAANLYGCILGLGDPCEGTVRAVVLGPLFYKLPPPAQLELSVNLFCDPPPKGSAIDDECFFINIETGEPATSGTVLDISDSATGTLLIPLDATTYKKVNAVAGSLSFVTVSSDTVDATFDVEFVEPLLHVIGDFRSTNIQNAEICEPG